jgi:hypothetical protein
VRAIDKQIQTALAHTQKASRLSPYAYYLARHVGLFQWMEKKTARFGSVGQEIAMSSDVLHREYWHTYEIPMDGRDTVFQVWIVRTDILGKAYRFGRGIVANPDYPNLYIAQQSGMPRRVILELDADETAVLHAILSKKAKQHFLALDTLTDDKNLQENIHAVFKNILARIEKRDMPYTLSFDKVQKNTIYLPLPLPESEDYSEKIAWLLERSDLIEVTGDSADEPEVHHEPTWQPLLKGDVARRLRQLDMVKEVGSVRGVYDGYDLLDNDDIAIVGRWEKLNLIERAQYEQRIVGYGAFDLAVGKIQLIAIMRDRNNDGIGQHFLLKHNKKQVLIATDLNGDNEHISRYKDPITPYFNSEEAAQLTAKDLEIVCEIWEDGLRLEPVLKVLFEVVERQQEYVSPENIIRTLHTWLGIEENEETAS